ncbi:hypothetical protein [Algoriphagus sp.]|uniref:hypothetical protein n=1 Tax=Algoriphagus sp. TaxID=1872435 RepID=UPI00261FC906|nr:hypothetical protein [Algoriphagus sp.]
MMKNLSLGVVLLGLCLACGEERKRINEVEMDSSQDSTAFAEEKPKVQFYQIEQEAAYPDAILELYSPLGNQVFNPGEIPFEFNIKNYPFGEVGDTSFRLYTILNGGDPVGFRTPIFQQDLQEGSYRVLAYLVDENGISLKNFGNYVDRDFQVGDSRPFPYSAEPYLGLNLPRSNQEFESSEPIVVDFLVVGGDMKLDGLLVQVELGALSYEVDHMAPIQIENMEPGDYLLQVKLLRQDGRELEGPFSSVTKRILVR